VAAQLVAPILVPRAGGVSRMVPATASTEGCHRPLSPRRRASPPAMVCGSTRTTERRVDQSGRCSQSSLTASGTSITSTASHGHPTRYRYTIPRHKDVVKLAHSLGQRLFHVQVADPAQRTGTGTIDWPAVLARSTTLVTTGVLVLEYKPHGERRWCLRPSGPQGEPKHTKREERMIRARATGNGEMGKVKAVSGRGPSCCDSVAFNGGVSRTRRLGQQQAGVTFWSSRRTLESINGLRRALVALGLAPGYLTVQMSIVPWS